MNYSVIVNKGGNKDKVLKAADNKNLLELLGEHNYSLDTYCGGMGKCGKCKVQVVKGADNITSQEKKLLTGKEIKEGIRLACLLKITGDMEINLQLKDEIVALTSGLKQKGEFNPEYRKKNITFEEPDLEDQRSFLTRLYDLISVSDINIDLLKKLDNVNKKKPLNIIYDDTKIIDIQKENNHDLYGLAIDIGTTTVVLYLLNLNTGKTEDSYSLPNPQQKFGADVISRINYTIDNPRGIEKMQSVIINSLNNAIDKLIKGNDLNHEDIYMSTIVGNTIMLHFFMGINAESIANSPFTPLFTELLEFKAKELGLKINKNGLIQILPSISGYIGADIVADMLAVNLNNMNDEINLLVDIGTNGEMVLSTGENIYTCSTAAGPAFEGANIAHGVAGIPGAISSFEIKEDGKIHLETIKDKRPEGICGSGLLDIVAEFYDKNIIKAGGGFIKNENLPEIHRQKMTTYNDLKAYCIVDAEHTVSGEEIVITQKDIREVQLAKGAIQAGIKILKNKIGIENKDIDNIYLAGGFGNYLNPRSACILGMLPRQLENKITQIGNGAGTGARICLKDKKAKLYIENLIDRVEYIELSERKDFQAEFMSSMKFGR